jgi:hypothetical protein
MLRLISTESGTALCKFRPEGPPRTLLSGRGFYPIDSSRTVAIEVDGQQLGLLFL